MMWKCHLTIEQYICLPSFCHFTVSTGAIMSLGRWSANLTTTVRLLIKQEYHRAYSHICWYKIRGKWSWDTNNIYNMWNQNWTFLLFGIFNYRSTTYMHFGQRNHHPGNAFFFFFLSEAFYDFLWKTILNVYFSGKVLGFSCQLLPRVLWDLYLVVVGFFSLTFRSWGRHEGRYILSPRRSLEPRLGSK